MRLLLTLTLLLLAFAVSAGEAVLSCDPATQNEDGTPYTNPQSIKVYYGTQSGTYTQEATLPDPNDCNYTVTGLAPGTWYFVATSVNTAGVESVYSNETSKVILPPAPLPPSNLTVQADNTVAYYLSISDNVVAAVPLGFVDAGVTCDATTSFNDLNRVDISDVHYVGTVRPPVVFAACGG